MPNAVVLKEKEAIVASLVEKMKNASAGVLVDYKGITVADDTKLRRDLREAGVEYAVVKNTLTRRACNELGFNEMDELLNGTSALAISPTDPVVAAKIIKKYIDDNPNSTFSIKSGFVDGKVISAAEVNELASVPSRETMLTQFLYVLTNGLRGFAVAVKAIADKQSEGTEAPAEAAAE